MALEFKPLLHVNHDWPLRVWHPQSTIISSRKGTKLGLDQLGQMGLHPGTFVEAIEGKHSFSCVVVKRMGYKPGAADILPPWREKLSKRSAILEERREIGARVLMTLFEHLDTIVFEASCIHELCSYMTQSPASWLLLKSVVLRLWCVSNHLRNLLKYRLLCPTWK